MSETQLSQRFRTRISPFIRKYADQLAAAERDKLLRQFVPDERELAEIPGFDDDPLREEDADIHPFPDVVHKYRSKILYLTTDECPVYCRYCTRKRKTLLSHGHDDSSPLKIAGYLKEHPEVHEVIFSGGDPLMLAPSDLDARARIFLGLTSIRHIRLHTRAVTTAPALVSEALLRGLSGLRRDFPEKTLAMVFHINTAAEISPSARRKISALKQLGIPVYSQSVLLRGVNDTAQDLGELLHALVAAGVQPYYLHQLDRVTGSAHFEVNDADARRIYHDLRTRVPEYMLPRFVRDSKQGKYPL